MTRLDYLYDSYQDSALSIIVDIDNEAGAILLDHTPVHPQGGHQASDKATISVGDTMIEITEAKNKAGMVWHYTTEVHQVALLQKGQQVAIELNWPRRYQLMRLHTAQHLFSALAVRLYRLQTVDLDIEENGCTLKFDRTPTLSEAISIQDAANEFIGQNRQVSRVLRDGKYLVGIESVDERLCGCTHVKSLSELGQLRVDRVNGSRIHFDVGDHAVEIVDKCQRGFLTIQSIFHGELDSVEACMNEFEAKKSKLAHLQKAQSKLAIELLKFQLNHQTGVSRLKIIDRPEVDIHMAREAVMWYLTGKKQIIFVRCTNGTILVFSTLKNRPASQIMTILKTYDPAFKGGGNEKFAQGGPWNAKLEGLDKIICGAFLEVTAYCD